MNLDALIESTDVLSAAGTGWVELSILLRRDKGDSPLNPQMTPPRLLFFCGSLRPVPTRPICRRPTQIVGAEGSQPTPVDSEY